MTTRGTPTWGEGVRVLRGIKGLSQIELATAVGVGQATISRIEGGSRQISDSLRVRIAAALEADVYQLFPYVADDEGAA
jgi:transcriptional regulator with XRE-family HTH domain